VPQLLGLANVASCARGMLSSKVTVFCGRLSDSLLSSCLKDAKSADSVLIQRRLSPDWDSCPCCSRAHGTDPARCACPPEIDNPRKAPLCSIYHTCFCPATAPIIKRPIAIFHWFIAPNRTCFSDSAATSAFWLPVSSNGRLLSIGPGVSTMGFSSPQG
jgi:hypothetical protein